MAKRNVEEIVQPSNDAYTGMLAISLIALLIGGALLYLDLDQYDWKKSPPPRPSMSAPAKQDPAKEPGKEPEKKE